MLAALLAVVAFLVVTPLALTLLNSFQLARPGQAPVFGVQAWVRVLSDGAILAALGNTFVLTLVRQPIALVIGIILAWLIARTDMPFRGALEFLFWISFFLPTLPLTMGWILLFGGKYGLVNQWLQALPFVRGTVFDVYSFWGIVWVHMTLSVGIKVMLLAPAFRNVDAALEESARTCGLSALA